MKITMGCMGRWRRHADVSGFCREQIKVVERPVGETTVDLGAKGGFHRRFLLVFANGIFDPANK